MRSATLLSLPLLAGAFVSGCLPIKVTYLESPQVRGSYRDADGTPIAGARVVVSTEYGDPRCYKAAAQTVTADDGTFFLPETKRTERFIILLPFDRLVSYNLCLTLRDTLRPAYRDASLHRAREPGGLQCFAWTSASRSRVNCGERETWGIIGGGRWIADSAAGEYRLATVLDPLDGTRLVVLAQWVAGSARDASAPTLATVDLNEVAKLFSLAEPELVEVDGRWQVHLRGGVPEKPMVRRVVLELRGPGEVRLVSDECPRNLLRDIWLVQKTCG
jgi:hypothetical protein